MPTYSKSSVKKLEECHTKIQKVFNFVIQHFDHKAIWGFRGQMDQDALYYAGKSQVKFPNSKHNVIKSKAIDVAPWPLDWGDERRFIFLAGFVLGTAESMGIKLRWGGDWNSDTEVKDNKFNDYGHFELTGD